MTDYERGVEQASAIYKEVIREYVTENTKLRDELAKWESLTANIELPKQPITEFRPKDMERENVKLRKLVADIWEDVSHKMYCPRYWEYIDRMRELGIEVDE